MGTVVVGVDPGPTPGICALLYHPERALADFRVMQINARGCMGAVQWLLNSEWGDGHRGLVAVERFVVGRRAVINSAHDAGQITRNLIGALFELGDSYEVEVKVRSAAEVKPWATDDRLKKAGLLSSALGMPHARDGCRHALFCAVADLGVADPLSKKVKTP